MLVPRQDSSISGRRLLAQHLAAAPCPEGTSCPRVTISSVPRPQLSAGTLLTAEQGPEGASPEAVLCWHTLAARGLSASLRG